MATKSGMWSRTCCCTVFDGAPCCWPGSGPDRARRGERFPPPGKWRSRTSAASVPETGTRWMRRSRPACRASCSAIAAPCSARPHPPLTRSKAGQSRPDTRHTRPRATPRARKIPRRHKNRFDPSPIRRHSNAGGESSSTRGPCPVARWIGEKAAQERRQKPTGDSCKYSTPAAPGCREARGGAGGIERPGHVSIISAPAAIG